MSSKLYEYEGKEFYLTLTPNRYVLVTHGGPLEADNRTLVGYIGARSDGTPSQRFGWVTVSEIPTECHNLRGALVGSHVSNPSSLEGQLRALCSDFLGESISELDEELGTDAFDQEEVHTVITEFLNSLPSA